MNNKNSLVIDGETTTTFIEKLDYSILSTQERLKFVDKLLNSTDFYTKFYSNPNNSEKNESIVSKSLEIMADYLMNGEGDFVVSKEVGENKRENVSLDEIVSSDSELYIESFKGNLYKSKQQKLYVKDFKDKELEEVLGNYQKYKEFLQKTRDKAQKDKDGKLKYRCDKIIGSINQDMLDVKNIIKKPINFKNISPTSPSIDWLCCDYTNENQIKMLLYIPEKNVNTDMGILTHDLSQMLLKANLTKTELKVINYIRKNSKLTQSEIANDLGYTQPYINLTLHSVAKKIAEYNKKLAKKY